MEEGEEKESEHVTTEEIIDLIGNVHAIHEELKEVEMLKYRVKYLSKAIAFREKKYEDCHDLLRQTANENYQLKQSKITPELYNSLQKALDEVKKENHNLINSAEIRYQSVNQELQIQIDKNNLLIKEINELKKQKRSSSEEQQVLKVIRTKTKKNKFEESEKINELQQIINTERDQVKQLTNKLNSFQVRYNELEKEMLENNIKNQKIIDNFNEELKNKEAEFKSQKRDDDISLPIIFNEPEKSQQNWEELLQTERNQVQELTNKLHNLEKQRENEIKTLENKNNNNEKSIKALKNELKTKDLEFEKVVEQLNALQLQINLSKQDLSMSEELNNYNTTIIEEQQQQIIDLDESSDPPTDVIDSILNEMRYHNKLILPLSIESDAEPTRISNNNIVNKRLFEEPEPKQILLGRNYRELHLKRKELFLLKRKLCFNRKKLIVAKKECSLQNKELIITKKELNMFRNKLHMIKKKIHLANYRTNLKKTSINPVCYDQGTQCSLTYYNKKEEAVPSSELNKTKIDKNYLATQLKIKTGKKEQLLADLRKWHTDSFLSYPSAESDLESGLSQSTVRRKRFTKLRQKIRHNFSDDEEEDLKNIQKNKKTDLILLNDREEDPGNDSSETIYAKAQGSVDSGYVKTDSGEETEGHSQKKSNLIKERNKKQKSLTIVSQEKPANVKHWTRSMVKLFGTDSESLHSSSSSSSLEANTQRIAKKLRVNYLQRLPTEKMLESSDNDFLKGFLNGCYSSVPKNVVKKTRIKKNSNLNEDLSTSTCTEMSETKVINALLDDGIKSLTCKVISNKPIATLTRRSPKKIVPPTTKIVLRSSSKKTDDDESVKFSSNVQKLESYCQTDSEYEKNTKSACEGGYQLRKRRKIDYSKICKDQNNSCVHQNSVVNGKCGNDKVYFSDNNQKIRGKKSIGPKKGERVSKDKEFVTNGEKLPIPSCQVFVNKSLGVHKEKNQVADEKSVGRRYSLRKSGNRSKNEELQTSNSEELVTRKSGTKSKTEEILNNSTECKSDNSLKLAGGNKDQNKNTEKIPTGCRRSLRTSLSKTKGEELLTSGEELAHNCLKIVEGSEKILVYHRSSLRRSQSRTKGEELLTTSEELANTCLKIAEDDKEKSQSTEKIIVGRRNTLRKSESRSKDEEFLTSSEELTTNYKISKEKSQNIRKKIVTKRTSLKNSESNNEFVSKKRKLNNIKTCETKDKPEVSNEKCFNTDSENSDNTNRTKFISKDKKLAVDKDNSNSNNNNINNKRPVKKVVMEKKLSIISDKKTTTQINCAKSILNNNKFKILEKDLTNQQLLTRKRTAEVLNKLTTSTNNNNYNKSGEQKSFKRPNTRRHTKARDALPKPDPEVNNTSIVEKSGMDHQKNIVATTQTANTKNIIKESKVLVNISNTVSSSSSNLQNLDYIDFESPASPPCLESEVEVAPKIIPLEVQDGTGLVKSMLKQLLHYPTSADMAQAVSNALLGENPYFIAKLILGLVSQDIHEKVEIFNYRRAPLLTVTQRVMLGLLLDLEEKGLEGLIINFLNLSEQYLVTLTEPLHISPVARIHSAICKLKFDYKRMRLMLCKVVFFMGDAAIPYLYIVLCSWFELLPLKNDCLSVQDALEVRTLVQIIRLKKCTEPKYNLHNLQILLWGYYGYSVDREDSEKLLEDLFKCYYIERNISEDVVSESLMYLIIALCKSLEKGFVFKQLDKLKNHLVQVTKNEELYRIIYLVGIITSQYCGEDEGDENFLIIIHNNKDWLQQFCADLYPEYINNAAKDVLRKL